MKNDILRYFLPKEDFNRDEWNSCVRIVNDIIEALEDPSHTFWSPNKMNWCLRRFREIGHEGLHFYILDLIEKVYGHRAADLFIKELEKMQIALMTDEKGRLS